MILISLHISRAAALETFEKQLFEYFQLHMAADIARLQGSTGSAMTVGLKTSTVQSLDELGMEIVRCCEGLDLQEVCANNIIYRQQVMSFNFTLRVYIHLHVHVDMNISADGR